jgi:hypothetical protein
MAGRGTATLSYSQKLDSEGSYNLTSAGLQAGFKTRVALEALKGELLRDKQDETPGWACNGGKA